MRKAILLLTIAITWFGIVIIMCTLQAKDAEAKDLHRFYSPTYNGHFYTPSEGEKDGLIESYSDTWKYEGVAYDVSNEGDYKPVHRFWSSVFRGHFYTISDDEANHISNNDPNWSYEGISFYVREEGKPVYRFWSNNYKHHFYTASQTERDMLINNDNNWAYEGVAWYVNDTSNLDRLPVSAGDGNGTVQQVVDSEPSDSDGATESSDGGSTGNSDGGSGDSTPDEGDVQSTTDEGSTDTDTTEVACETVPKFTYYMDAQQDEFYQEGSGDLFLQYSTGYSTPDVDWRIDHYLNGHTPNLGQNIPTEDGQYAVVTDDRYYFTEYWGQPVNTDDIYQTTLSVQAMFDIVDGCVVYPYKTNIDVRPFEYPWEDFLAGN